MTIKAVAMSLMMLGLMLQVTRADQTTPPPDFDASADALSHEAEAKAAEQAKQKAEEDEAKSRRLEEARKAAIKHASCMIETMRGEPESMQPYAETLCTLVDTEH
jgi:hypothetical protein